MEKIIKVPVNNQQLALLDSVLDKHNEFSNYDELMIRAIIETQLEEHYSPQIYPTQLRRTKKGGS